MLPVPPARGFLTFLADYMGPQPPLQLTAVPASVQGATGLSTGIAVGIKLGGTVLILPLMTCKVRVRGKESRTKSRYSSWGSSDHAMAREEEQRESKAEEGDKGEERINTRLASQ